MLAAPAQIQTEFLQAVWQGDEPKARRLLAAGADVNKGGSRSPLIGALIAERESTALLLLELGADLENAHSAGSHYTPLQIAISNNMMPVVVRMIELGVNVNAAQPSGWTPLHEAAHDGRLEAARMLLENGARVNHRTRYGESPLLSVWGDGYKLEMIRLLVEAGADVNFLSKSREEFDRIREALNYKVVLITEWDYYFYSEKTPLMAAAYYGHIDAIQYLIQNGADPTIRNQSGNTAEAIAVEREQLEAAVVLREAAAGSSL